MSCSDPSAQNKKENSTEQLPYLNDETTVQQRLAYGAKYSGTLESILKCSIDEYNHTTYSLKKFQHSIIKTYMWLATVVFGAESAFFLDANTEGKLLKFLGIHINSQHSDFVILASVSVLLSLCVFLLGVDTMRGRKPTQRPTRCGWLKIADLAYTDCDEEYRDGARLAAIRDIEEAINSHLDESSVIGRKLRLMSAGILVSIGFAAMTMFCK